MNSNISPIVGLKLEDGVANTNGILKLTIDIFVRVLDCIAHNEIGSFCLFVA